MSIINLILIIFSIITLSKSIFFKVASQNEECIYQKREERETFNIIYYISGEFEKDNKITIKDPETARAMNRDDPVQVESEPFVVTVYGSDQPDIIAVISGIFASQNVNIENLKAIRVSPGSDECVLVFEVALSLSINRSAFRQMLHAKARSMGLTLSMQHQDIFEAIHRVPIV